MLPRCRHSSSLTQVADSELKRSQLSYKHPSLTCDSSVSPTEERQSTAMPDPIDALATTLLPILFRKRWLTSTKCSSPYVLHVLVSKEHGLLCYSFNKQVDTDILGQLFP
jgi:hypothetical protein